MASLSSFIPGYWTLLRNGKLLLPLSTAQSYFRPSLGSISGFAPKNADVSFKSGELFGENRLCCVITVSKKKQQWTNRVCCYKFNTLQRSNDGTCPECFISPGQVISLSIRQSLLVSDVWKKHRVRHLVLIWRNAGRRRNTHGQLFCLFVGLKPGKESKVAYLVKVSRCRLQEHFFPPNTVFLCKPLNRAVKHQQS